MKNLIESMSNFALRCGVKAYLLLRAAEPSDYLLQLTKVNSVQPKPPCSEPFNLMVVVPYRVKSSLSSGAAILPATIKHASGTTMTISNEGVGRPVFTLNESYSDQDRDAFADYWNRAKESIAERGKSLGRRLSLTEIRAIHVECGEPSWIRDQASHR